MEKVFLFLFITILCGCVSSNKVLKSRFPASTASDLFPEYLGEALDITTTPPRESNHYCEEINTFGVTNCLMFIFKKAKGDKAIVYWAASDQATQIIRSITKGKAVRKGVGELVDGYWTFQDSQHFRENNWYIKFFQKEGKVFLVIHEKGNARIATSIFFQVKDGKRIK